METKFVWNNNLATGFDDVDLQHKKLILLIEDVHESLGADSKDYSLRMSKVLKSLVDYTVYHFSEEEQLMKRHGYSSFDTHKREHELFVSQVQAQIKTLSAADPESGQKLYKFLGTWLLAHIARTDQDWAAFIKMKTKK